MTHGRFVIGVVALFALLWGALLFVRLREPPSVTYSGDAGGYHEGAVHLVQEGAYMYHGRPMEREPGQSLFLAFVYALFGAGNRFGIFLMQGVLYVLATVFFVRELRKMSSSSIALLALCFLLLLPAIFHILFSVYRESTALSLFLLFAASFLSLARRPAWPAAVGAGAALGALLLTYIPYLFFPFLLLPLIPVYRVAWKYGGVVLLLAYVPIMLWGVRNVRYEGRPCLAGCSRAAVMWYVRGEQAEHIRGIEPLRCLYAEYISRDWETVSPACSFNALMHERWPEGFRFDASDREAGWEGRAKIFQHIPSYLWFSLFEVLELHLPYVNGWGFLYNILATLGSLILYVGCFLSLPRILRREYTLFLSIILYSTVIFALTDATPRYLMPTIFCYATLAAVGFSRFFKRASVQTA